MTDPDGRRGEAAVLELLTGPEAREVLGLVLGTVDARVADHAVHKVQHRPGDGVTVGYRVWARSAAGTTTEEYVLVSSSAGRDVPDDSPGLARLDGPGGRLLAWRHPHDPALPGLAAGCDPVALEALVPGAGPVTDLQLVGYRPLRRAVLRAVRDGRTSYVKVLRPKAGRGGAADVVRRHALLTDAGVPVPRVLASSPEGVVVLEQAAGVPLLDAIGADGAHGLELVDLVRILDALPPEVGNLPRRPAWSDRADAYADAVAASGRWARRARDLARTVRERSTAVDLGPIVATHGDVHEGQLTARRHGDRWVLAGLLDVDTVGPGHRVDDLACLVAHAVALGPAGVPVLRRWEADARRLVDADALGVRTAGVLLSLAAGAVHERHVAVPPGGLLAAAEERLRPGDS